VISFVRACTGVAQDGMGVRAGSRTGPPAAASCSPAATVAARWPATSPGAVIRPAHRLGGWQGIALAAAVAAATR
jgi:hypothetical protein